MNDPLAALRPLHSPPPVPWWPPAPGWWLALAGLAAAVMVILWYRKRTALGRAALLELKSLQSSNQTPAQQAAAVNRLLKRFVRARWPEERAVSLSGQAWLEFLDARGGNGDFARGPGRVLLTLPYAGDRDPGCEAGSGAELIALAGRWISGNARDR